MKKFLIFNFSLLITLASCSVQQKIGKSVNTILLKDSSLLHAHLGISIYDPATEKYLYNYQGDKYFVPASNTKLFSCYAAMKYLGDSLNGIGYYDYDDGIIIVPTGDPSFLHDDFKRQPVLDFLQKEKRKLYINKEGWREHALGYGWAWDDYNGDYMVERSPLPVYGNVVKFSAKRDPITGSSSGITWKATPGSFLNAEKSLLFLPYDRVKQSGRERDTSNMMKFQLQRDRGNNFFYALSSASKFSRQEIPIVTDTVTTALAILKNDLNLDIVDLSNTNGSLHYVKSQPTDSVLKPMMHRSDNFFAEQMLLMVSYEKLGYINDAAIIDTILKTDLAALPQKPKWVDGSGLSRYNLFTPQDFIFILNKMRSEFGMKRLQNILATGGEGTISSYYQSLAGQIFAKTGTLSNNCALSGFLHTKSGKWLIFSILANNYQTSATPVRRAVEKFINHVRDSQ